MKVVHAGFLFGSCDSSSAFLFTCVWFDRPGNTVVHSIKVTPDLFFCQAWYCCSAWDPSVPEVHWAAHQEAAFPAPCQGNRPGFQDRSAFPECSYWRSTGIELNFIYIFYILLFKRFFFCFFFLTCANSDFSSCCVGSQWGILGWTVWGHQPVRYSCKEGHHYAQGHSVGQAN